MLALERAPNEREQEKLRKIFLTAETAIINEIGRLRSMGLVDYHAVAALERVQQILVNMEDQCWTYVPQMVEKMFYVRVPEARKALEEAETVVKHLTAYQNAAQLTSTQADIVQQLTANLMGEISEAADTTMMTLRDAILGRQQPDVFREVGLEATARVQATGRGVSKAVPEFVRRLQQEGVTAFVDKAGRHWRLHTYCDMAMRTTSRQAEVMAVLTADEQHDLYQISRHGTTCKLCAPFEGRVYSRSGKDPVFPPLAAAFGKVDPAGPDELTNTWLNIHPNCLHAILPWTPAGRTPEEIQKIKDFSDPRKNPFSVDPRTKKQIEDYRKKEVARRHKLETYRQWERYRMVLGDKAPKTFSTFEKHKRLKDQKYKDWERMYREANRQEASE